MSFTGQRFLSNGVSIGVGGDVTAVPALTAKRAARASQGSREGGRHLPPGGKGKGTEGATTSISSHSA